MQKKQSIDKLLSCVMYNFNISAASSWVELWKTTMTGFLTKAKNFSGDPETRDKEVGIPSIHLMNATLLQAIEVHIAHGNVDRAKTIQDYITEMNKSTDITLDMGLLVPHFMVIQPFNKKVRRVEIGFPMSDLRQLFFSQVLPILQQEKGFKVLVGQAPKGQLQRQIQLFLDPFNAVQRVDKAGKEDEEY